MNELRDPPAPAGPRAGIQRQARVSGARGFDSPTLEAVEARRMRLWMLSLFLLMAVTSAVVLVSIFGPARMRGWTGSPLARFGALLVVGGFGLYVVERERALRRLARLLVDERVLAAALSNRLKELATLLRLGKTVNTVLGLPDVLEIVLTSALELLDAPEGSLMLAEEGALRVVCSRGNEAADGAVVALGAGIAGRVAVSGEALLVNGTATPEQFPGLRDRERPVRSAMSVPLALRGEVLGVLNVSAGPDREFTEHDLRATHGFAEHAAAAIGNARHFACAPDPGVELAELSTIKAELAAVVGEDAGAPVASLLRRAEPEDGPGSGAPGEFAAMIERQGRRLLSATDRVLVSALRERQARAGHAAGTVDLAKLVRAVAEDLSARGHELTVAVPESCQVATAPDEAEQVLVSLLDNAFEHGGSPARVSLESGFGYAILTVTDAGPGVPREDRRRIFEPHLDEVRPGPDGDVGLGGVQRLVSARGGRVWVEAAPTGGAAFRVLLPAVKPIRTAAEPDRDPEPVRRAGPVDGLGAASL